MTKAKLLMIQGTSSGAGKSTLVTALCRIFSDRGYRVVPFKAQNMSSNVYIIDNALDRISLAQAVQAVASRKNPDVRMNPILLKPLGDDRSNVILDGKFYNEMHAKEYYEKALAVNRDYYEPNLGMGSANSKLKDYNTAVLYYERAHQLKPEAADPFWGLAIAYHYLNEKELASKNAKIFIDMAPDSRYRKYIEKYIL